MDAHRSAPSADFAGTAACAECHRDEAARWRGSHHDLAMQEADAHSVLGDFGRATLTYNGITSTFFRRGADYMVRTDGPDGALHDYRIAYAFGVAPLQQYLIEFPDGRLQALGIAWDTRPKADGGQRWFHLYPDERVDARDELHWTRPAQNWNFMCAECHSTGVRKRYDPAADRFATTWAEINVGCEACHGPGAKHIAWARGDAGTRSADPGKGFAAPLGRSSDAAWVFSAGPIAHLDRTRDRQAQIEACGRCHARRSEINEEAVPGRPLADTHVVALLDDPLYYADGQIRDEVYEYGSFLQSRMHAAGVACTDCHDPHSGRLRAEGNALCAKCHQAAVFDTPAHHHHPAGTAGAQCVACHMPARTYMVVDRRRDHSFRVPRPDLSTAIGTPNTCTDCHRDRSAAWAADALRTWGVSPSAHSFRYAEALAAGRRQEDSAGPALTAVIADPAMPALVRATALTLLAPHLDPRSAALVERALQDPDPLVRRAALTLLPAWPPPERWQRGAAALRDPVRTVRLEAVDALAAPPGSVPMSAEERADFERAVAEYRDVQRLNADRPESGLNLGALDARLGNTKQAEKEYRDALRRQPNFVPVLVNLADLYRQTHRDADAEPLLRQAVATAPQNGDVHYALGLLFVRQRRVADATDELGSAAALRPDNPHYAYAHALALDAAGRSGEAIERLEQAQARFPRDREILEALVDLNARAGHADAARRWQGELRQSAAGSGTAP